ncbi:baseplate assembly protein [Microvirga alba]|uniref:Baseplate J/gp47 family protein n=1 Tax=Microvirga alba TaxID=2791025 RepID=A0A931BVQ3_9HYPH|nr:baseplate J/gp47 family protein [Microvirga alba]MBF9235589.1 baseplate J/gp47 family protein [Microvirga alba]
MASAYTKVDLSQLAPPNVVETLDFESILAAMLADLRARDPAFTAIVESDPAYKILEVAAYRELLIRQRVNDAAKAVMVAYAQGADLDQIAANYDVARLLITPADDTTIPPTEAVFESDDDFRVRILLSLEGYTTAGSKGSYIFHALSASGDCKDVSVTSLTPGTVNVAVLSRTGTGSAPATTIAAVTEALNAEVVRPLCDTVAITSAQIVNYQITASLVLFPGAGQAEVLAAAQAAAEAYAAEQHRLGRDITRSGVFAALHQPGVQNVTLTSPAADIVNTWNQAPWCTSIAVTIGGIGE